MPYTVKVDGQYIEKPDRMQVCCIDKLAGSYGLRKPEQGIGIHIGKSSRNGKIWRRDFMLPKGSLINCSGCLSWHPQPSCLRPCADTTFTSEVKYKVGMTSPFLVREMVTIFGDHWEKGLVSHRNSPEYLPYIEKVLTITQAELEDTMRNVKSQRNWAEIA